MTEYEKWEQVQNFRSGCNAEFAAEKGWNAALNAIQLKVCNSQIHDSKEREQLTKMINSLRT